MADNHSSNDSDTKYIGVRIQKDLYWRIKERLLEKRLSMSEAIIQALIKFLEITDKELIDSIKTSNKITDINDI